jgi:hypothetical protein
MASKADIPLECFQFSGVGDCGPNASLGREPQPQAKGHNRHGADAAQPKAYEPQQALRQRRRLLLLWHQW